MRYVDTATITVQAGSGGPGKISFIPPRGGPNGGNGGRGGDIYIQMDHNVPSLEKYLERHRYNAENGHAGQAFLKTGRQGEDLTLYVPPFTTVMDLETHRQFEITPDSPRVLICKGGAGGLGNNEFKSPTRRTPRISTPGKPGQQKQLTLTISLLADVGFIGLPNAGKSSLLNMLTAAAVRTAPYPFTTLEPNLGAMGKVILADIPGLIEGASQGKGLGTRFLKHIEKVSLLLHCISVESSDVLHDYHLIRNELGGHNKELLEKESVIVLTKIDLVDEDEVKRKKGQLDTLKQLVLPVSTFQESSITMMKGVIEKRLEGSNR